MNQSEDIKSDINNNNNVQNNDNVSGKIVTNEMETFASNLRLPPCSN